MFSGLTNQVSSWMGSKADAEEKVPTPTGEVATTPEKKDTSPTKHSKLDMLSNVKSQIGGIGGWLGSSIPKLRKNEDADHQEEHQPLGEDAGLSSTDFPKASPQTKEKDDDDNSSATGGADSGPQSIAESPTEEKEGQFGNGFDVSCIIIDSGYSFTHIVPYIKGKKYYPGIKRIFVGGKLLTNYLKDILSYRKLHVMEETYVINQVKEDTCFVSQSLKDDMKIVKNVNNENSILRNYILPDFNNIRRGYVQDPNSKEFPENCQILHLNNERFTIPELLMRPSNIGMQSMGIPEAIAKCVELCPAKEQQALMNNIVLIVQSKAIAGAKSFGSFLYSAVNKAGKTVSEASAKIKKTVEENSILGEFNREQEAFLKSQSGNASSSALPPWAGCANELALKEECLTLSTDRRNFVRSPPAGVDFTFDYEVSYPVAMAIMEQDPNLEKMRYDLVPKIINEENFWRNYFYRVTLLCQANDVSHMSRDVDSQLTSADQPLDNEVKDPEPHEFVSDSLKVTSQDIVEVQEEMKKLSMNSKATEEEWEKELEAELQDYEMVSEHKTAAKAENWDRDIEELLDDEQLK